MTQSSKTSEKELCAAPPTGASPSIWEVGWPDLAERRKEKSGNLVLGREKDASKNILSSHTPKMASAIVGDFQKGNWKFHKRKSLSNSMARLTLAGKRSMWGGNSVDIWGLDHWWHYWGDLSSVQYSVSGRKRAPRWKWGWVMGCFSNCGDL